MDKDFRDPRFHSFRYMPYYSGAVTVMQIMDYVLA
jgi:hypothetical protein